MPDSSSPPRPPVAARDAFAALPLEGPARSAWPAVAAAARRRRARPRRVALWTAAAAAVLLLALWMPRLPQPASAPPDTAADITASPPPALDSLDALVQRSQTLEARLQDDAPALRSGSAVLAARWIAADIGAIDVALAESDPTHAAMLWRARVALLDELDGLRSSEAMAATGSADLVLALD